MTDTYAGDKAGSANSPDIPHSCIGDIEEARCLLNRFFSSMTVGAPGGAESFKLGIEVIQLGPITVGALSFGAPVTFVATELDASHVIIPTSGRVLARHAGHEVTAGPTTGAVLHPGHPVFTLHDAHTTELHVKIERSALEAELADLLGRPVDGPIDLAPAMNLSDGPGQSWSRLVTLLRDELGHAERLIL